MEDFESAFTNKNNYTLNSFSQLSTVLKTGEALSVRNPALGEVEIRFGERNDGLAHIILRRIEERTHRTQGKETLDVASKKVTMILELVKEAAEKKRSGKSSKREVQRRIKRNQSHYRKGCRGKVCCNRI